MQEKTSNPYLAPSIDKAIKTADISELHQEQIQDNEFPERPGEPECPYFMKTGSCKYKSACKFHHPKTRLPKPILSNAGLPLRPVSPHHLPFIKKDFFLSNGNGLFRGDNCFEKSAKSITLVHPFG